MVDHVVIQRKCSKTVIVDKNASGLAIAAEMLSEWSCSYFNRILKIIDFPTRVFFLVDMCK